MKIENVSIELLKPASYNPRKMNEKDKENLRTSIERFGMVDPLIVNKHKGRENIIIGGHQRYLVAKEIGIKELPVVYVDLSEEKEKELNLRLNRNQGEWDYDALAELDVELLKDVGFEDYEIIDTDVDVDKFFEEADERSEPKKKKIKCPKCGHEFEI